MTNNYLWNRLWTFREQRGHVAYRASASWSSSLVALGANLALLAALVALGAGQGRSRRRSRSSLVTPLSFIGNKLWSFQSELTWRWLARMGRALALAVRRRWRCAAPALATTAGDDTARCATPLAPSRRAAPDRGGGDAASSSPTRRSPTGSAATRRRAAHERGDLRQGRQLDGEGLVGRGRRDRRRAGSTTRAARHRGLDRARRSRGRWRAATPGAFGGKEINSVARLARASARVFFIGLADLRRPLSAPQPRPARAALVLGLALVLQPRANLHERAARLPAARLPARRMVWIGVRGPAATGVARPSGRSGCSPRRRSSSAGFRVGLNVARLERDRRRLRGRDRRPADRARPVAVRPLPGRGRPQGRAARPTATARSASGSRRTAAASRRTRTATRTARSLHRVHPRLPDLRLERQVGRPARRALHARSLFDLLCLLGLALVGLALRRQPAGGDARVRLGRLPVHAVRLELEHERRDHARVPDLGLLARAPRRGRAGRSSRSPAWTKFAALLLAPLWATYPDASGQPPRGARLRRPASRSRRSSRSGCCCSSRTRCTPRTSSGTGRLGCRSTATRRSRSGTGGSTTPGLPDLHGLQQVLEVAARRRRGRARLRAAAEVAAPARRADGGAPDRLRARAHPLVLPLPAVVLPLRRLRGARAGSRRAERRRPSRRRR